MRCKWFSVCPMRIHEQAGRIDSTWREKYCQGDFLSCVRFQKEEAGVPHSDKLLPDGSYLDTQRGTSSSR